MDLELDGKLKELALKCPFPLYVVGGYVRDAVAGISCENGDIDICAPVGCDEFLASAQKCGAVAEAVYRNTGTVKFRLGKQEYEFASFRSDEYVRGIHNPVKTFFTDDIVLDAKRRDFKCNAVYYDIKCGELSDPLGGIEDIRNKKMTTVADPDKVFGEDGLRLMRLARQSAQTGFEPSEECLCGALNNAGLIADVSAERVYAELNAILHADTKYGLKGAQYRGLKILDRTGVIDYILPELALGRGMAQRQDFHSHDVLEHSLRCALYADASIRLAALLHDCAKPYCKINEGEYKNHAVAGERICREICARLKVPKKLSAEVSLLCALHMYDLDCKAKESKVRRFIVANCAVTDKLLLLKQADFSACKDNLSVAPTVAKWKEILFKMSKEGVPFTQRELNVRGDEIIAEGVPKDYIGKVLGTLLLECATDAGLNVKEKLLRRALSIYNSLS